GTSWTWSGSACSRRSTSSSDLRSRLSEDFELRFLNRSAGRLSLHRRGPVAGLVVLLLGLLLSGGLYAALSPTSSASSASNDEELVKRGRELFLVGCAFCHGQNAEGQTDINGKL